MRRGDEVVRHWPGHVLPHLAVFLIEQVEGAALVEQSIESFERQVSGVLLALLLGGLQPHLDGFNFSGTLLNTLHLLLFGQVECLQPFGRHPRTLKDGILVEYEIQLWTPIELRDDGDELFKTWTRLCPGEDRQLPGVDQLFEQLRKVALGDVDV